MNMKKFFSEFLRRGLIACGFGPIVLAIVYMILHQTANVQMLTVNQVCIGIFSITILAYFVIWAIIYSVIRRNIKQLNKVLKEKQECVKADE